MTLSLKDQFPKNVDRVTATISSSGTTSTVIDCGGMQLRAIEMPATFTGTALTVLGSYDNGSFFQIYNIDGNPYTINCGANRSIKFTNDDFNIYRYIKLVSNQAESASRSIACLLGV